VAPTLYSPSANPLNNRWDEIFSTALSLALRARGLPSTSPGEGRRAFFARSLTSGRPSHSHA